MIIGIDFGGVLSVDDALLPASPHINTRIDMPGAYEAIVELSKDHKLYLISFCGKRRAMETKASIQSSGLAKHFAGLYFVKHPDYKSQLTRYLGCDAMIDDRVDVLDNIRTYDDKIHTLLFNNPTLSTHTTVPTWGDVLTLIPNLPDTSIMRDETIDITRLCYTV
jgi:hypothetical protein